MTLRTPFIPLPYTSPFSAGPFQPGPASRLGNPLAPILRGGYKSLAFPLCSCYDNRYITAFSSPRFLWKPLGAETNQREFLP